MGQRGGGVILYFRNFISVVHIQIDNSAEHCECLWCNIVTLNSLITTGLIYYKPSSTKAENDKILSFIKKFSNKDCIIMWDLNYGNIK